MPGTRKAKYSSTLAAALLTLAVLSALPGCYARRSIPSDPPGARAQSQAQDEAVAAPATAAPAPAPAPTEAAAATAPVQTAVAEAAPAKAETTSAQATPAPAAEPTPAAEPAAAQAEPAAPAQTAKTDAAPVALREYSVQIGAFGTEKNAQGAVAWLKEKGFDSARMVRVEQGQSVLYRVRTGAFQDLAAASKALETLKADWPQAFIPAD